MHSEVIIQEKALYLEAQCIFPVHVLISINEVYKYAPRDHVHGLLVHTHQGQIMTPHLHSMLLTHGRKNASSSRLYRAICPGSALHWRPMNFSLSTRGPRLKLDAVLPFLHLRSRRRRKRKSQILSGSSRIIRKRDIVDGMKIYILRPSICTQVRCKQAFISGYRYRACPWEFRYVGNQ